MPSTHPNMAGVSNARHRLVVAAEDAVDDACLSIGMRDRLAHFDVVERRLRGVHAQDRRPARSARQRLAPLPMVFNCAARSQSSDHGEIAGAGLQIGDACRSVRHGAENTEAERPLGAPISVVARQRHLRRRAARLSNLYGPLPTGFRLKASLPTASTTCLWHDRELDQLGQQRRIGALGRQRHRVGAGHLGVDDLVELAELRAGEFRIDNPLDAEDDIVRPSACEPS